MKIIYDLGSNNGDDIEYYLLKADKVIAVEANSKLCSLICSRFKREIKSQKLTVINAAITDGQTGKIRFYVNKKYHWLSSLIPPKKDKADQWEICTVDAIPIEELVNNHGSPFYMKIDIEGYDENILNALHNSNIRPPLISAEAHTIGVFTILSEKMGYKSFKMVDGQSVSKTYRSHKINVHSSNKQKYFSFKFHSAGPFGDDIKGDWLSKDFLLFNLGIQGLGWKDIHASSINEAHDCTLKRKLLKANKILLIAFLSKIVNYIIAKYSCFTGRAKLK